MRRFVLMVLLAVASASAAAEWVRVREDGGFTTYADPSTIRRTANMAEMWSLTDSKTPRQLGSDQPVFSVKSLDEFDCKEKRSRTVFLSAHSGHMGEGKTTATEPDLGKWSSIQPQSLLNDLWEFACGKK